MTNATLDSLRRLIAIDAALASRDGLHVGDMARTLDVTTRTLRREMDVLREMVGPTVERTADADNQIGRTRRHWYADRRRRLFAPWLSG
jgi:predicted ArsR family transcriptional regulator